MEDFFAAIFEIVREDLFDYILIKLGKLTWGIFVDLFMKFKNFINSTNIAATVKVLLENGKAVIVQGIFNKNTGDAVKAQVIDYDSLDSRISDAHRDSQVVIWELN